MVHDPRVSSTLARLGGVYRDPGRVDRDASSLLRSSVGNLLRPIAAEHAQDDGQTSNVLVLQGTIAIHFRGNTYQLLVDIYLPKGYPTRPPVCFVRLAENMYLKENHKHCGSDGKIYLPYLHEWRPHSHNLVELVVAMSSVFSADPPVFTRAPGASSTSSASVSRDPPASSASSSINTRSTSSWQQQSSQQAEAALAAEAAEANAAIAAARRADKEEQEREAALQAQREWETSKTNQVRQAVARKVQQHFQQLSRQCQQQIQNDWRDQQRLNLAKEQKIQPQLELYRKTIANLERQCVVVQECHEDLQAWLEEAENNNTPDESAKRNSVDDLVQPQSSKHAQMLHLSAENAAIADALYCLDRALYRGSLTCDNHLKQVRRLAKRQFLVRAHLIKINQTIME